MGRQITDEQIAAAFAAHREAQARGIPVHDLSVHDHAGGEDGAGPHEHPHEHREGWTHSHDHSHPRSNGEGATR